MQFTQSKSTNVKFLPEIVISQEHLIIETQNLYHWIQHTSNPKYAPLKPFQCILPSQSQQNVKFLPKLLTFQEPLIIETQNLHHWIQHISDPKHVPLKLFGCISPSQNQQNVQFVAVCLTPHDKNENKINLYREKVFEKA